MFDGVFRLERADEVLAYHLRSGGKEPDVEESVGGGTDNSEQPVALVVDLADGFVDGEPVGGGGRPDRGSTWGD